MSEPLSLQPLVQISDRDWPAAYVIQRRLERAKRLLRQTHQPVALIAQEAGFADQSYLTQVFRREMGVTPGRYRAELA